MSKLSTVVLLLATFFILSGYQNCGKQPAANPANPGGQSSASMQIQATVKANNLDGCTWTICSNDAAAGAVKCWIPKGIDPCLLVDGNIVEVNGSVVTGQVDICMAGSPLQVTSAQLMSGARSQSCPLPSPTSTPILVPPTK